MMDEFTQRMNDMLASRIGQLTLDNISMQVQLSLVTEELTRTKANDLTKTRPPEAE